jgi:serralysin
MCWMCDERSNYLTGRYDSYTAHMGEALYTAVPYDGVGDLTKTYALPTPTQLALAASVLDDIPNDTSTTVTITVGGPRLVSTLNTPGDFDFVKVELQAGVTYDFGMYSKTGGPTGVPLSDPYIEIYDSAGNKLAVADGGATTQYNNANPGLDVLYSFTAEYTGTYYINARSFDNVPEDGDTGDQVGDYELFAKVSNYKPYYDLDSPLHSLDWGTQFDGTSRNPDGDRGTRPDGLEVENKIGGKNVIYVYFARQGDVFVDNGANPLNLTTTIVAKGLQPWERQAFENVFAEFEKVADIDYVETEDRYAADIVVVTYDGTPGMGAPSLLGRMSPPDTASEGQTEYNAGDERWTQEGLAPGGFYFGTLIHEFGHGHGMAHPHDNGGKSSIMRDSDTESGYVEETSPFNYTLGDYDLNQGVYTMMSYMDGWQTSPYGQPSSTAGYGFIGSLMAFDIAVIQDKYGVNEEWATGNDTYTLMDVNQKAEFDANGNQTKQATAYKSIWDAGGTDEIVYNGTKNANIDLRPATLQYEYGGGGWISYAFGIHGGYTIANGVTIENATSGGGNDTLRGNSAANRLDGGAGNDSIRLQDGGDDTAIGGLGNDSFYFGGAMTTADAADGGDGKDAIGLQGNYTGPGKLTVGAGVVNVEQIILLAGNDTRFGDAGTGSYSYDVTLNNANVAAGAKLLIDAAQLRAGENATVDGSAETDGHLTMYAGLGANHFIGGAGNDGFLFRGNGVWGADDKVVGGAGNDQLGLRGNLVGGNAVVMGADQISGIESIILLSGSDTRFGGAAVPPTSYDVTMHDGNVAAGERLTVDGAQLLAGETMVFNGSAETNGFFRIFGGASNDSILGGAGNDSIRGNGGSDTLSGGGGGDTFVYGAVAESTGTTFDRLLDFDSAVDRLDLNVTVSGWNAPVSVGVLNQATFNSDLALMLDGVLDAGEAVLFTANVGDMAGRRFLIVDGNGDGAYTEGQDYVFELGASAVIDTSSTAIFV